MVFSFSDICYHIEYFKNDDIPLENIKALLDYHANLEENNQYFYKDINDRIEYLYNNLTIETV